MLKHHCKIFGDQDTTGEITMMTNTDIQGFPRDRKNMSIHDIVKEIKEQD